MRILMAEHFPLDYPLQVGSHHICRAFVERGHDVFWLFDPIHLPKNPFRFFTDSDLRGSFTRWFKGVYNVDGAMSCSLFSLCPWVDLPGLRSFNGPRRSLVWSFPSTKRTLKRVHFDDVDLLWLTYPKMAALTEFVKYRFLIHRITDDYLSSPAFPKSIKDVEIDLLRKSDLVVSASECMSQWAHNYSNEVTYMPNSINIERFTGTWTRPEAYKSFDGPIFVYVGGVYKSHFVCSWIEKLARKRPDAHIVLIGPRQLEAQDFGSRPNVHLLGMLPYKDLPPYLVHADVGIMPMPNNPFTQAVNPLKVLEYLACGIPVVATNLPETARIKAPINLVSTADEFVKACEVALVSGKNASIYESYLHGRSWNSWMDDLELKAASLGCDLSC